VAAALPIQHQLSWGRVEGDGVGAWIVEGGEKAKSAKSKSLAPLDREGATALDEQWRSVGRAVDDGRGAGRSRQHWADNSDAASDRQRCSVGQAGSRTGRRGAVRAA
jgi:hypothetical protein